MVWHFLRAVCTCLALFLGQERRDLHEISENQQGVVHGQPCKPRDVRRGKKRNQKPNPKENLVERNTKSECFVYFVSDGEVAMPCPAKLSSAQLALSKSRREATPHCLKRLFSVYFFFSFLSSSLSSWWIQSERKTECLFPLRWGLLD